MKPCPYCGGKPYWSNRNDVFCQKCGLCKNDLPQATRVYADTVLAGAVTWNNLGKRKNDRIILVCPVCGSHKIEHGAFYDLSRKRKYYCRCANCSLEGPHAAKTPFEALELFKQIRAQRFRNMLGLDLAVVTVESGHRAQMFDVKASVWDIQALKMVAEQRSKYDFWKAVPYTEPIHLYWWRRPFSTVVHKRYESWPKLAKA